MQNIGDRLAEARKRLGIALREASEATKIRTDYLQAMENGTFDFSLPDVYKRGFLKIYANFLKLDADKLAEDYATQMTGGNRENLGRVETPGGLGSAGVAPREREPARDYDNSRDQEQAAVVRLIIFLGVAAVLIVLLIVGFRQLLESSSSPSESAKTASTSSPSTPAPPAPAPAPAPVVPALNKFVFSASGDIANLTITDDSDHLQLSSGPLKKGKSLPLSAKGRVAINVSQTQYLSIQLNNGAPQSIADRNGKLITGPLYFYWPPGAP